jgi:CubicO group peptidase (beta-lactamase class C family)
MRNTLFLYLLSIPLLSFAQDNTSNSIQSAPINNGPYLNVNDTFIDLLFTKYNNESPGIAVLIVQNGNVLLRRGYGMANLENKVPITPTTVFDIASLSKQFTGMTISMLIEQGKISLNDDIRKYIPEIQNFGHEIKIDNLVHHTSGLRDWCSTLALAGWSMDDVISFDQILNMAYNQQALNFDPGSEYSYSNTEYNLLAELVHRVTGKTFREWTDTNIFQPLKMMDTHFHDDYSEIFANKAYSYEKRNDGRFHAVNNGLEALGSSSLYTTIDDLAKWVTNLDNPRVGGKSVIDRMFQQGILNNGTQIPYAFGLNIGKYRGAKEISHSGSWASFSTYLTYFPEHHFSVVVLHNFPANAYKATHDIVDKYLADKLEPEKSETDQNKQVSETVNVPIPMLDRYVGKYRLGPAWYITISRNNNQLISCATAEGAVPMKAISDSTFWVYGSVISFYKNDSSNIIGLHYRGMTCPKVQPGNTPLTELTGKYISEELKTIYDISVENGQLVAKHIHNGTILLTPAWKDDFEGGVWFMKSVEFYRDKNGKVAGFIVTTNRSRNQHFIKKDN